ncbi:MAG: precorrin-6y C5,15-methyltransferase (decarboxylating) subunit CbiE [Enterobacteriaceae bacterium]|jgi:cobalt-precorrin-7 (C5)-methyltransferase|nr:precorrin-6y C5,15-methyltransferase (decarboxylating) subunit CbiE [Enterobacteriaceae bacterium]
MITVAGIGPGALAQQTLALQDAVQHADILVGGARHLALFPDFAGEKKRLSADIEHLLTWLERQCQKNSQSKIVVLASGDPLFYGIGKRIAEYFTAEHSSVEKVQILSGISAIQYLCSQIHLDMNDIYLTSSHGRKPDFDWLLAHSKIGMVTDKHIGPREIAAEIVARGQKRLMVIGENLSQDNQRITYLKPDITTPYADSDYAMNVVLILDNSLTDGDDA